VNKSDRQAWRSARTFADLGELTAQWIEGKLGEQLGYCGPSDLDDPERLVPLCAALCRAGYMTTQSQEAHDGLGYDGAHWAQRAAVEGFASPEMTAILYDAAHAARLWIIARDPGSLPRWRYRGNGAVPVTVREGRAYTRFGTHLPRRHLRDDWIGYGICHPDAVDAVCGAWQVTVIDPEWGRPDALWKALDSAARRSS
jgi:uncharacterized protein DUF6919